MIRLVMKPKLKYLKFRGSICTKLRKTKLRMERSKSEDFTHHI